MTETARERPTTMARLLGFGGLIPFVGLALASWIAPPAYQPELVRSLVAYAATIASFVGALHWGAAMHRSDLNTTAALAWGVVPSLVAWSERRFTRPGTRSILPPSAGIQKEWIMSVLAKVNSTRRPTGR